MKESTTESFEELLIPRRDMHDVGVSRYRVYSDYKNYKLVEASSALAALAASGITRAYKIERHDPFSENIIHITIAPENIKPENIKPENQEAETAAPASAAPLSNDDVEKLLSGG